MARNLRQIAAQKSAHNRSHVPKKQFHEECKWCWASGGRVPVRAPNMLERQLKRRGLTISAEEYRKRVPSLLDLLSQRFVLRPSSNRGEQGI